MECLISNPLLMVRVIVLLVVVQYVRCCYCCVSCYSCCHVCVSVCAIIVVVTLRDFFAHPLSVKEKQSCAIHSPAPSIHINTNNNDYVYSPQMVHNRIET